MTEQLEAGGTFEQNKRFEQALAFCLEEEAEGEGDDGAHELQEFGRWKHIAALVPGKSQADVRQHYALLLQDVAAIDAGKIALPHYLHYSTSSPTRSWEEKMNKSMGLYGKGSKASEQDRKKGIPWTEEEHRLFLLGLNKFGKGDWRSISRNYVVSRTPTQVASHAQKYYIRLNSINKDKRRSSIHDITNANSSPPLAPAPPPPATAAYPPPRPPAPPPSFARPPLHLPPLALLPPSHLPYAMHHHQ